MLKLTIEFADAAELGSFVSRMMTGAAAGASTPKPAAKAAATPKAEPAIDFKTQVSPLIIKLADLSRDKAVALLGEFGVAKGAELKPAQYAEFIEKANAAIEAVSELG